jgi:hypothetical protein
MSEVQCGWHTCVLKLHHPEAHSFALAQAWPSGLAGAHCWEVESQYELAHALELLLQGDPSAMPHTPMVQVVLAHWPSPLQLCPFLSCLVHWLAPQNIPGRQSVPMVHGSPALPPLSHAFVFGLQKVEAHSFELVHATPDASTARQAAVPVREV